MYICILPSLKHNTIQNSKTIIKFPICEFPVIGTFINSYFKLTSARISKG